MKNKTINEITDNTLKIANEFMKESQRGAVLIGASQIDELLKSIVEKHLIPFYKKENIFSPHGPLGTFSSRIKLAYSVGIIGSDTAKVIDKIRGIRNDFAHKIFEANLETQNFKNKLFSLEEYFTYHNNYQKLKKHFCETRNVEESIMFSIMTLMIIWLTALENDVRVINPDKTLTLK